MSGPVVNALPKAAIVSESPPVEGAEAAVSFEDVFSEILGKTDAPAPSSQEAAAVVVDAIDGQSPVDNDVTIPVVFQPSADDSFDALDSEIIEAELPLIALAAHVAPGPTAIVEATPIVEAVQPSGDDDPDAPIASRIEPNADVFAPAEALPQPGAESAEPSEAGATQTGTANAPAKPGDAAPLAKAPAEAAAPPTMQDPSGTRDHHDTSARPPLKQPTPSEPAGAQAAQAAFKLDAPVQADAPATSTPSVHVNPLDASATTAPKPGAAPAEPAQATPAPTPREVEFAVANHERIVSSIRTQLLPRGGSMQLRLDPPNLGAMQVSVRMLDGVMSVSFQTSTAEATQLLGHSLAQLRHVLQSQGVSVDKIQVQQAPRDADASRNEQNPQQRDGLHDESSGRQEQQRKQMLQRMWRRLALGSDPLDMVA